MHRAGTRPRRSSRGVLRTCGDAPDVLDAAPPAIRRSPHVRGCTELSTEEYAKLNAFSARAGMHLHGSMTAAKSPRVLRTCGDAPRRSRSPTLPSGRSPHVRGCTDYGQVLTFALQAFSARAGMHRPSFRARPYVAGVLRTCGDAPPRLQAIGDELERSPHVRGCTELRAPVPSLAPAFSARAGMHRHPPTCHLFQHRVLRTCGDAPDGLAEAYRNIRRSPHVRGCTVEIDHRPHEVAAFSARAGMHRASTCSRARATRVLRTCGDAPRSRSS